MSDTIWLSGITAHARHGVFDFERENGQEFTIDVGYEYDTRAAARTDSIAVAVSYADVAAAVHAALTSDPVALIEALAESLARAVLAFEGIDAVTVVVHKPHAPLAVPFSDVTLTIRRTRLTVVPQEPVTCVLALGGNLGDVPATLRSAIARLTAAVTVDGVGPLVRTGAMTLPGSAPQDDYWNTVLVGRTALAATELLNLCQAVELAHGRERHERWGARSLDVDIVAYGGLDAETNDLTLPHPGATTRAFVLVPWASVDSDARVRGLSVAALAEEMAGEIRESREVWL
ncbi:MAG: 2-amino-4-hydroxy-6-hydroxymethyldihydropteridine diphosphokinase [Ruaniaceae bacterium]|nr:2-amino-4-hydroxy-6-hydroxymethyldihydropteridine diphosphokinase [Ruaniaceae bacterium]